MIIGDKKSKVFCAFCKGEREVYSKKHTNWVNFLCSMLASISAMFLIWGEFTPKFLVIFIICLLASEMFIQLRWRLSLTCGTCAFDPILYLKNPEKAVGQVSLKLELFRSSDVLALSKKNPFHRLPQIKREIKDGLKSGDAELKEEVARGNIGSKNRPVEKN